MSKLSLVKVSNNLQYDLLIHFKASLAPFGSAFDDLQTQRIPPGPEIGVFGA